MDILSIVSIILGILTAILGGHLILLKNVIKEFKDIPDTIDSALSDGKITPEELKEILKEVKEFTVAIKALF